MIIQNTTILFLAFFAITTYANDQHKNHESHTNHQHKDAKANIAKMTKDSVTIKVKGMVCAFCAQGIEKNFNKLEEVKTTKVNLDTMEVVLTLKKGKKLSVDKIQDVVKSAGFKFEGLRE